jgi:hypothetical protein
MLNDEIKKINYTKNSKVKITIKKIKIKFKKKIRGWIILD